MQSYNEYPVGRQDHGKTLQSGRTRLTVQSSSSTFTKKWVEGYIMARVT